MLCLAPMGLLRGLVAGMTGELPSDLIESFRARLVNSEIGVPVSLWVRCFEVLDDDSRMVAVANSK